MFLSNATVSQEVFIYWKSYSECICPRGK